jgi:hypothetical protein
MGTSEGVADAAEAPADEAEPDCAEPDWAEPDGAGADPLDEEVDGVQAATDNATPSSTAPAAARLPKIPLAVPRMTLMGPDITISYACSSNSYY